MKAIKDMDKICIKCGNKYSMMSFGSTKDTCSNCFKLKLKNKDDTRSDA